MILECPSCDSRNITTIWIKHIFQYGAFEPVTLKAHVPLRRCQCCGESYLDYLAEEIVDRVVADHKKNLAEGK